MIDNAPPSRRLRFLLARNDGGVWGEEADGDGDTIVLRSTEQSSDGRWRIEDPAVRKLSSAERRRFRLKMGDVLVTKSSGSAAHIGKATLVVQHVAAMQAAYSNFMQRLRPGAELEPRYLWYSLQSRWVRQQLQMQTTTSTGLGNLTGSQLGEVELPGLELKLQRAIADYLDRETTQIDAFIAKNEELIAFLKERRSAAVTNAVTAGLGSATQTIPTQSPVLGRIPEHWDVLQLRHLLVGIDQGVSPQADAGLASEGQWGVLKSGCVNDGMFRPEEHKALPTDYPINPAIVVWPGDLLVNRASGSLPLLGSAGIVSPSPFKLILSDKTFRLLPNNRVHTEYLYWWLNSRSYREQIAATVSGADGLANNLPMATLRGFVMPLPPKIEQAEIARHLSVVTAAADRAIQAARRAISLARERRAALISAAVTGKIDVGVAA